MGKFIQLYRERFSGTVLTPAVVLGAGVCALSVSVEAFAIVFACVAVIMAENHFLLNEEGK